MENQPSESLFEEKETHIIDYLIVILKRKRLIMVCLLISFISACFYINAYVPIYQATAKLIIDTDRTSSPITGSQTDAAGYRYETENLNTHFILMKSRPVIEMVITALELDAENNKKDLEVSQFREIVNQFKENIKLLLKKEKKVPGVSEDIFSEKEAGSEDQNARQQNLFRTVTNKIAIDPIAGTRLFTITVKDKDPELSADIANTLAKKYTEFDLANRVTSSKETLEWLNNEMYALLKKLEDAEQEFFEYKQQNKVFSIEGKQGMATQKIIEFNNKYLEARNRRVELEAKINELNKSITERKGISNVRSLISNPIIETIYAKIIDLELELNRLNRTFKSKHPKIIQTKSELDKTRNRLTMEIEKELHSLKSEREVLLAREKTLEKTIGEFETDALKTSSKELKYTILQRNVNTSQNLYDLMVSRVKESNILQTIETSNIRVVERAQIPLEATSDAKKKILILSIVLGLGSGIGIAFFLEYLDRTIRTEEDIQYHFNLPVLTVIPLADRSEIYGEKS